MPGDGRFCVTGDVSTLRDIETIPVKREGFAKGSTKGNMTVGKELRQLNTLKTILACCKLMICNLWTFSGAG